MACKKLRDKKKRPPDSPPSGVHRNRYQKTAGLQKYFLRSYGILKKSLFPNKFQMKAFHKLANHTDLGVLALRLTVGVIFLVHGFGKFSVWGAVPSEQISANMIYLMKFLSVAETLGAIALIFGFLTNLAALGLSLIMLGAILWFKMQVLKIGFVGHNGTGWEFDLSLLAINIFLFLRGAGKYSVDAILNK